MANMDVQQAGEVQIDFSSQHTGAFPLHSVNRVLFFQGLTLISCRRKPL